MVKPKPEDVKHLDEFQKRCNAVENLVHHVVTSPDVYGFYLWGPRGVGKSTGIERALKKLKTIPVMFRGSATGESLFIEAKNASDGVLWFNDDPGLLAKPEAQQYLLAMLEPITDPRTGKSYRLVTKSRVKREESFRFKGKIIFDSNSPVTTNRSRRMLEAVEDRLQVLHFGPTDNELAAVARYLVSLDGDPDDHWTAIRLNERDKTTWKKTTVKERLTVADYITDEARKYKTPLSLRMLRDAMKYFVAAREYNYTTDWRDYVTKQLARHDVESAYSQVGHKRDDRLQKERDILVEVIEDAQGCMEAGGGQWRKSDLVKVWCGATGLNDRQFRRRLEDIPADLRKFYDSLPDGRRKPR